MNGSLLPMRLAVQDYLSRRDTLNVEFEQDNSPQLPEFIKMEKREKVRGCLVPYRFGVGIQGTGVRGYEGNIIQTLNMKI